jgi:minor extracellular serine protease Vpr
MWLGALFMAAGCSSHETGDSSEGTATPGAASRSTLQRWAKSAVPRRISPAFLPGKLDTRAVKAVIELQGDAITAVQARDLGHRLTPLERDSIRADLRLRQLALKPELERLGTHVLRSYQNAYNGIAVRAKRADLPWLAKLPGVVAVHALVPKKLLGGSAAAFVGASAAWSKRPRGLHGERIKVAVIDTGIDYTHANFGGPGTLEAFEVAHAAEAEPADPAWFGPDAPRIKGGVDLVGDAYDASSDDPEVATPHPDENPLDCGGHGSHVAGIVGGSGVTDAGATYAGPYDVATADGFRIAPGVAPLVDLYAVRVFGCEGATTEDIDGIEWAVDHDVDVINLSLGTDLSGADDPSSVAASNAVKSGVVVVAAAGNAGGAPYVAGSPASGDGVLSVAALDANQTLPGVELALDDGVTIRGRNMNAAKLSDGKSYPLVVLGSADNLSNGCSPDDYAGPDVASAIVVALRGSCALVDRLALAQAAGAAGVVLVNNRDGDLPFVGETPGFDLPLLGVRAEDAPLLLAASTTTLSSVVDENANFRLPALFSSSGPRFGDSFLKPSVIAPGVGIVSTQVGSGNFGVGESGTSMATPVVAGLAALTRQAHPSWSASDIATALANTADPGLLAGYEARRSGSGVPQAGAAIAATASVSSAGAPAVNFGFVELGRDTRLEREVTLQSFATRPLTFELAADPALEQGYAHQLSLPSRVKVPARGRARFKVSVSLAAESGVDPLAFNDFAGSLVLKPTGAGSEAAPLRLPYYGVARPEARLKADADLPSRFRPWGQVSVTNRHSPAPGSAEIFAWGIGSGQDDVGCNDVRAAGVEAFPQDDGDRLLVFVLNGWRRCSSASHNYYDFAISLDSGDAYEVVGIDVGLITTGDASGELGTLIINDQTGETALMPALASTDSSLVYLTAPASLLGLSPESPRFSYAVEVGEATGQGAADAPSETASFNAYTPSLLGLGAFDAIAPGDARSFPIGLRTREWARTPAKGLMVVLAENAPGSAQARLFPLGAGN